MKKSLEVVGFKPTTFTHVLICLQQVHHHGQAWLPYDSDVLGVILVSAYYEFFGGIKLQKCYVA